MAKKITKILIANRGEIAVRITKACEKLGIHAAGIYGRDELKSSHITYLDSASFIDGPSPYLNQQEIINVALRDHIDAIHPGYGFLSENAGFAFLCEENNITFIGPSSKCISVMGSKAEAKKVAEECHVPTIPGYVPKDQSLHEFLRLAEDISFPVLLKAVYGGGGKGMHIIEDKESLKNILPRAKREAKAAFSEDSFLLEKYFPRVKHCEVQIAGDTNGRHIHLFERDCSVQRRYQKVLEECPIQCISDRTKQLLRQSAIKIAEHSDYVGVGTVEFIVDLRDDQESFYFLEMNTRIQVEHPVTEMITGIDLVCMQIQLHQGHPLPFSQDQISIKGHSVECRLYGESPKSGFLPVSGTIRTFRPYQEDGIRYDHSISDGEDISIYYDPLVAKVITYGKDRSSCLVKMKKALSKTKIFGLETNQNYLLQIIDDERFLRGDYATDLLQLLGQNEVTYPNHQEAIASAFIADALVEQQESELSFLPSGWRSGSSLKSYSYYRFEAQDYALSLQFDNLDNGFVFLKKTNTSETKLPFTVISFQKGEFLQIRLEINGMQKYFEFSSYEPVTSEKNSKGYDKIHWLQDGGVRQIERLSRFPRKEKTDKPGFYLAPLTGKVQEIFAKVGGEVENGDPLLTIESMKMEHMIHAKDAGVVKEILKNPGELVEIGATLITVENH